MDPDEERICEKIADVSQYCVHDDDPPSSPIKLQALGKVVVECEKGTFYSPDSGEEQVGDRPLIFAVGNLQVVEIGGCRGMIQADMLYCEDTWGEDRDCNC